MEKNYITILEISKPYNKHFTTQYETLITTSLDEQTEWIREKQEEQVNSNYGSYDRADFIDYSYNHYDSETILDVPLNELKGLTLGELLKIIK